jgi:hypothetical protein
LTNTQYKPLNYYQKGGADRKKRSLHQQFLCKQSESFDTIERENTLGKPLLQINALVYESL